MGISLLRATGRLLAPVVAVGLLAGVSPEAGAVDYGKIALSVPNDYTTAKFVYERGTSTLATQLLVMDSKGCTFGTSGTLVGLTPGPGPRADLGMGPTSIGVYDGPSGVPCYRVSSSGKLGQESLGLKLNSNLPKFTVTDANGNPIQYQADGFNRLELDIEAKGDLLLKLKIELVLSGGIVQERVYELRTGAQVKGLPSEPDFEADPAHRVFNCSARSDSGNDSGSSDNCRWVINDWGNSFTMTPETGEFSLEGGGDQPPLDPDDPRTLIYLTDIQSGLGTCGVPVTATGFDNAQFCSVTLKQFGQNQSCKDVPYALLYGGDSCEFLTPLGTQVVANVIVAYEPEDQVAPGSGDAWIPSPLSRIIFAKVNGSFPIPPCLGLTLTDYLDPAPIDEVKNGGLFGNAGSYDLSDGNNTIEFACAYFRSENYVKPAGSTSGKTYIEEWVQFWSDPVIARGQN